jgi:hypothetical protein
VDGGIISENGDASTLGGGVVEHDININHGVIEKNIRKT